jgi:hypothetical protein
MCRNKKRRAKYKRTLGILAGLVIGLILIALICAREADRPKREDFTPVVRTIQAGDTAWHIADEYCPDTLDKRVYLGWCEQLNGGSMGYIKAGEQVMFLECVR